MLRRHRALLVAAAVVLSACSPGPGDHPPTADPDGGLLTGPTADPEVSIASVAPGPVQVGPGLPPLEITNTGDDPVALSFDAEAAVTTSCPDPLPAGARCTVSVTSGPAGDLVVTVDGERRTIPVRGPTPSPTDATTDAQPTGTCTRSQTPRTPDPPAGGC